MRVCVFARERVCVCACVSVCLLRLDTFRAAVKTLKRIRTKLKLQPPLRAETKSRPDGRISQVYVRRRSFVSLRICINAASLNARRANGACNMRSVRLAVLCTGFAVGDAGAFSVWEKFNFKRTFERIPQKLFR